MADALIRAGFDPGEDDITAPSRDTVIYDGMTITLMRTVYETFEYLVDIPYETKYIDDKTMYKGDTKTVTPGALGKREIVIKKTMVDGLMFDSDTLSAKVISEPVTMVVKRGTKAKPVATTKPKTTTTKKPVTVAPGEEYITLNGKKYKIEKKIVGEAVAYYSTKEKPITATGNVAVPWKTVAVDPKVIPYGSIVYVAPVYGSSWSYGPANAHDTGVKGNTVDMFMETYEQCIQHGRRSAYIYILTPVD